jgi:hypothetical protein
MDGLVEEVLDQPPLLVRQLDHRAHVGSLPAVSVRLNGTEEVVRAAAIGYRLLACALAGRSHSYTGALLDDRLLERGSLACLSHGKPFSALTDIEEHPADHPDIGELHKQGECDRRRQPAIA